MWILICLLATTSACSRTPSAPPPPSTQPSPNETITGNERIGWDQRAADASELATFRYAIYVDTTNRMELSGAACATTSTNGSFACTAPLPRLTNGAHALELASYIVAGSTLESARSSVLRVTVGAAAPADTPSAAGGTGEITVGGDRMKLELVIEGVERPVDLAFAHDGRLLVAEESGDIQIIFPGQVRLTRETMPNHTPIVAMAVDPEFDRTRFVYTLSIGKARDGAPAFTLARLREVGGTFGDRVVLLGDVRASASEPAGALRFGPDGKLFAAFDDGGNPQVAHDLAAVNAKVLRLNSNGTTPDDQAGGSPLYSFAYRSPKGLDWLGSVLWVVDAADPNAPRLNAVTSPSGSPKRGATAATVPLPSESRPSSMAAYRGERLRAFAHSLLVASAEGRHLLRVRLDPTNPTQVLGTDRLLQDRVGAVRVVAVGPDGAVYLASDSAIHRLVP
jgi:glucose/arabinose dehydrogenase